MTDDDPIVVFIASQPEVLRHLLAEHVDDGTGHCQACPIGGQRGYLAWPCNIALYVTRASRVSPPEPEPSPGPLAADPAVGRLPGASRRAPRVVRAGAARRADDQRRRRPGQATMLESWADYIGSIDSGGDARRHSEEFGEIVAEKHARRQQGRRAG
jgi:hypothetical protein